MALSHAGLLEEEVTSLLVEKDWDDGRLEYDVDFWQEMVEMSSPLMASRALS